MKNHGVMAVLFFLAPALMPPSQSAEPTVATIAGTGRPGFSGDGGPATAAQLNQPFHCDFDPAGRLLIAEAFNHCVRLVDLKTGRIDTLLGSGEKGFANGPARKATLNEPYATAVDRDGNLYIADRLNAAIRKYASANGAITTIVGTGEKGFSGDGGPGTSATLREPNDCCLDGKGGLLIADVADWRIRRLDLATGIISTFAGTGRPKGKVDRKQIGDGGPADKAVIVGARAVCADGNGNVYICEREGNAIRRVNAKGVIATVAGTGAKGYSGDGGPALSATMNGPKAIRCDAAGNLFIVDTENHAIRKMDAISGTIVTVAGGRKGTGPKELDRPHGCVVAADGAIYIADSNNHRVQVVRP